MLKFLVAPTLLGALAFCGGAHALSQTSGSPYDLRIKSVVYNPVDVVRIDGVEGLATTITLAPGERYSSHVFGTANQWRLVHHDNQVFIRPIAELSDTNLTLVTNRRVYYFVLKYHGSDLEALAQGDSSGFIQTPWEKQEATLAVIFKYQFEDLLEASKDIEQSSLQRQLEEQRWAGPQNLDYLRSDEPGMEDVRPKFVWDNYRFTYFEFPENAELPTIFAIAADGKEMSVNARALGDNRNILEVDRTAREWRIRLGSRVVGIVNQGFDPNRGATPSGTVSPGVERVLKQEVAE